MKITLQSLLFSLLCFSIQSLYSFNDLTESASVQRVRVNFVSPSGNLRPLLLGFTPDDAATDGVDYGYDAKTMDNYPNDLNWIIENERYVIQGVGHYATSKFYPFGLYLAETGDITISLTALENFDSEIPVYLYDSVYDDYTKLNDTPFVRFVEPGTYVNRFFLAFSTEDVSLSIQNNQFEDSIRITYNNGQLYFKFNDNISVDNLTIYNIDGKQLFIANNNTSNTLLVDSLNITNIPLLIVCRENSRAISKLIVIPD